MSAGGSPEAAEVRGATRRLMKALAVAPGRLVEGGRAAVVGGAGGERRLPLPDGLAAALARADLVRLDADGGVGATAAGIAWLRRSLAGGLDPFRAQQGRIATAAVPAPDGGGVATVLREEAGDSPLAWLSRRRGRDGRPLLGPARLAAGERLAAEFTFAGLEARVTMDWSAFGSGGGGGPQNGGRGGAAELSEQAAAARERVRRALSALGPELAGIALDVCCLRLGLEEIERARGWPARSAKVVLAIALDRLADHYGLAAAAHGPAESGGLRHWGGEGYRPRP